MLAAGTFGNKQGNLVCLHGRDPHFSRSVIDLPSVVTEWLELRIPPSTGILRHREMSGKLLTRALFHEKEDLFLNLHTGHGEEQGVHFPVAKRGEYWGPGHLLHGGAQEEVQIHDCPAGLKKSSSYSQGT